MKWNLRLAAAQRESLESVWNSPDALAEHGLVISTGKMSGLWSGRPVSLRLEDLDVICVVLGCEIGEYLLIPEPEKVSSSRSARGAARYRHGDGACGGAAPPRWPLAATGLSGTWLSATLTTPRVKAATSCRSCLAWGMTRYQGMCRALLRLRPNKSAGDCGACGRREPLKAGYCRLCWTQAALDRATGHGRRSAPYLREVRHQQLFLAGLNPSHAIPRALPHDDGAKGDSSKAPPPAAIRPNVIWLQLPLLIVPRYYRYGRVNPNSGAAPENPWLDWALHLAHAMAEARGFHLVS